MSQPIPPQRISLSLLRNPTSIESALRRLPTPPPPPPTIRLLANNRAGGPIAIGGGVALCYGAACVGAVAICLANGRPIKCPDWGEFNDELARWTEYLALLAVCSARWAAAQLQRDLEILVADGIANAPGATAADKLEAILVRDAADAALLEAFLEFIACVAKADADYQASGGRPTNNSDRQF